MSGGQVPVTERIDWTYEGGRLGGARRVEPGVWECEIAGDTDEHGQNRSAIWFAFDVKGLGGRRTSLDLLGLENEWNLRPSVPWGPETRPVVAPGRGSDAPADRAWRRLTQREVTWQSCEPTSRLQLAFEIPDDASEAATVAYIEPYTYADHRSFMRRVPASSAGGVRHRVLGQSAEGRAIDLLTIGERSGERAVWLVFRQHPWETYSSYAAEGLVDWLLSAQGETGGLVWQVVPMVNVDGCARGHTRHNAVGKDPNREWNETAPTAEVACIREAIGDHAGGAPAVFVDVHNNNQQASDYVALSNGFPGMEEREAAERRARYGELVSRLAARLEADSHFSGTVRGGDRVGSAGTENPAAERAASRGRKPFEFPSVLLEMRTGPLPTRGGAYGTIEDQRRLGAALGQSILEALA